MEFFGWLSTIAFTLAGFPQAFKTIKEGHARGFSLGFLTCWFLGNLFGAITAFQSGSLALAIGFSTSVSFGVLIWRYKIWERKDQ